MSNIKVEKGEPVDRALRRLKKQLEREGLLRELKEREFYEKPSQSKRRRYLKVQRRIEYTKKYGKF